jgi:hypothetical protein
MLVKMNAESGKNSTLFYTGRDRYRFLMGAGRPCKAVIQRPLATHLNRQ